MKSTNYVALMEAVLDWCGGGVFDLNLIMVGRLCDFKIITIIRE